MLGASYTMKTQKHKPRPSRHTRTGRVGRLSFAGRGPEIFRESRRERFFPEEPQQRNREVASYRRYFFLFRRVL